jgi:hypothetical protein
MKDLPFPIDSFMDLKGRLNWQGHAIHESEGGSFSIIHNAKTMLTVSTELDPVLRKECRGNYFLCKPDAKAILAIVPSSQEMSSQWTQLIDQVNAVPEKDWLSGPGSWMLANLATSRVVYMWTVTGYPHREPCLRDIAEECRECQGIGVSIEHCAPQLVKGPVLLQINNAQLTNAIGTLMLFARREDTNCFVTNEDCSEAYEVQHHDEIFVSIPDINRRARCVQVLLRHAELFADSSHYE